MYNLTKTDKYGMAWGGYRLYNTRASMMYRICNYILQMHGADYKFYYAFTSAERLGPIAYGKTYEDFDLLLEKTQIYFIETTPIKYRIYLATHFCKSYGERVKAAIKASAIIKGLTLEEILSAAKFPIEALDYFVKRNKPFKSFGFNGKKYYMNKIIKYLHEKEDIFNPKFYKKSNLIKPVDIDDIPDQTYEDDLHLDDRMLLSMMEQIAETFGFNKEIYIGYLDSKLTYPIAIAFSRQEMLTYQRRLKKLYYVKTTPLKCFYYLNIKEISGFVEIKCLEQKIGCYISSYFWLHYHITWNHQLYHDFISNDNCAYTIHTYSSFEDKNKPFYYRWMESIKKWMNYFKMDEEILKPEFYSNDNIFRRIEYSQIRLIERR